MSRVASSEQIGPCVGTNCAKGCGLNTGMLYGLPVPSRDGVLTTPVADNGTSNAILRGEEAVRSLALFFVFSPPLSTCILSDLSCGVILGGLDSPSVTTFRHFNRFVCFPPPIQYVYTNLLCCTVRCSLYVRQIKGGVLPAPTRITPDNSFIQTRPPLLSLPFS